MTELVSMLVPLETLPGWPAAANPPWLEILGLLIGLPAAVVIVFALIGKLGARRHQPEKPVVTDDEPLWLGGPDGVGEAIPGGERKALPATVTGGGVSTGVREQAGEQVGGASARW